MKHLVLGVALSLASAAATASDKEFCDAFADSVFTIATQRDDGVTRREMRNIIITRVDSELHQMFLLAAEIAYTRPYLEPNREANGAYDECMKARLGDSI